MAKTEKTTMRRSLLVDYFGDIIGEKDHKPPAVMVLRRLTCHQIKKPSLRTAFLLSLVSLFNHKLAYCLAIVGKDLDKIHGWLQIPV